MESIGLAGRRSDWSLDAFAAVFRSTVWRVSRNSATSITLTLADDPCVVFLDENIYAEEELTPDRLESVRNRVANPVFFSAAYKEVECVRDFLTYLASTDLLACYWEDFVTVQEVLNIIASKSAE
jgi:hypothetical protein